jgi:hypothetical protein
VKIVRLTSASTNAERPFVNDIPEITSLSCMLPSHVNRLRRSQTDGLEDKYLFEYVAKPGVGGKLATPKPSTRFDSKIDCIGCVVVMQELLAIQQNGAKNIAFFGTRNMGFLHQQLVEILSYAMVLTGNHIYTSGGLGTNAAVIRGALRAERPDLLTVILPQSLEKQPEELHELLQQVEDLQCTSENDSMKLFDASRCVVSRYMQHQQRSVQEHHSNRICAH